MQSRSPILLHRMFVFLLCLTICHFNVTQDTHLCPTMLVEYYPLYQSPLLPVHIYPFTFNPTCKLPKSCYILTNVDQHTEKTLICVSTQRNNRAESVSPLISGGWKILLSHFKVSQWVQLKYLHLSLFCLVQLHEGGRTFFPDYIFSLWFLGERCWDLRKLNHHNSLLQAKTHQQSGDQTIKMIL